MDNNEKLRKDKNYIEYLVQEITLEHLKRRIAHQLYTYANRAHFYKRFYMLGQCVILIFPILAVIFEFGDESWKRIVSACLMTSITVMHGLIKGVCVKEKWFHYRKYCEIMKKEVSKFFLEIEEYENVSNKNYKILSKNIEKIVEDELNEWGKIKVEVEKIK